MPNGQVVNFNHKKVKEVLSEFFDYLNVGDMCTIHEVLEYLTTVPLSRLKDVHPRHRSQNRKVGFKQLFVSRNYFARVCANLPHVVRGTLYARSSKYMIPLTLIVKTNENRDTVCFNCEEYLVGGAKDYVRHRPNRKMPVIARHVMCSECYKYEVKMFNPSGKERFRHFDEQYEEWERRRDWSEEE